MNGLITILWLQKLIGILFIASVEASISDFKSASLPGECETGIRFQVTNVTQPDKLFPTKTLDEIFTPEDWNKYMPQGFKLIGIWDKSFMKSKFVSTYNNLPHPFISATFNAYSKHYPLKIRPDDIWLTILQAAGLHINMNSEELRSQFVNFKDKKLLAVVREDFIFDSLDNDWGSVTLEFLKKIGENTVGDFKEICETTFSTSTPLDHVTRSMTVMNVLQKYFDFHLSGGCGFPYIMLEGKKEDWIRLKESTTRLLSKLGKFGTEWSQSLLPLLDKMTEPFNGVVDSLFWNSMYTLVPRIYSSIVWEPMSGWINILFPYLNPTSDSGDEYVLNKFCVPYDEEKALELEKKDGKDMDNDAPDWKMFPNGRVFAPGTMEYLPDPKIYNIRYYSGFLGVNQDADGVISTQVGWYVLRDLEIPS